MILEKTFTVYLYDGSARGRIKCSSENWSGAAFKIPKSQLDNCGDIDELNHAGIYFLFSESAVYIGAGKLSNDETFWSDAVIFVNTRNSFDSTGLKFLKHKFSRKIADANRYELKSVDENFSAHISVEKINSLEVFAEYVETILYFLGYKIFEPPAEIVEPPPKSDDSPTFYLERIVKGKYPVRGKCKIVYNKFVVLKGSLLVPAQGLSKKGISKTVKDARKKAKISEENILLEEVFFDSASAAGSFVTGTSTQGPEVWQTKDGMTIAEFLSQAAEE